MSTCKNIHVGLNKPPKGKNILFYASMDGTIQPEIGELPTYVDRNSIEFREGAYGLQTVGGLIYPLKGLNLEKPFTIAFTLNAFPDSFQGQWTGIFLVTLKTKDTSTDKKIFSLLTTEGTADTINSPVLDMFETSKGIFLNKANFSEINKYRRLTVTSDGTTVFYYVDGLLKGEYKIAEFPIHSAFKGAPDMQIDINWGHNKNGAQKFGVSEVLIAQEYLPPIGLKAYPDEKKDDIILPKKNYFGITTQAEIKQSLAVTLPATWNSTDGFVNNYVYASDLSNVCQKGNPNVKIRDKHDNLTWQVGDKIEIDGILGEIITGTPSITFKSDNTPVQGSWTGLNTSTAIFTISNVVIAKQLDDIVVSYTATKSKQDRPYMEGDIIDSITSLRYKGRDILPEVTTSWIEDARAYKFIVDGNEVAIHPQTMTIKPALDVPTQIVAELSDVPVKPAYDDQLDFLAKTNPLITVSALNRLVKAYPKVLGFFERAPIPYDSKKLVSYNGGGAYIRNNGVSNIVSTQAIAPRVCYKSPYSRIPFNGNDFGNLSDVDVKPVFFYPYLAKATNGELVVVYKVSSTNTVGKFFDSLNVSDITSICIPTGIFEK